MTSNFWRPAFEAHQERKLMYEVAENLLELVASICTFMHWMVEAKQDQVQAQDKSKTGN